MQHDTVVVVAGGEIGIDSRTSHHALPSGAPVIAADGGVDLAHVLGLDVHMVVGDLDSASKSGLAAAEAAGATIVRHPAEKDATDLELACDEALALGPRRLLVLGVAGGRLDHLLAGLLLLGAEKYAALEIDADLGQARAHVIRGSRELTGGAGELISLLALNGPAEGVATEGLAYPLRGETLLPGSSRGVSNVFAAESARIEVDRGVVLAVRPGQGG